MTISTTREQRFGWCIISNLTSLVDSSNIYVVIIVYMYAYTHTYMHGVHTHPKCVPTIRSNGTIYRYHTSTEMVNDGPIHWNDIDMYDVRMHGCIRFMSSIPTHPTVILPIEDICPSTIHTWWMVDGVWCHMFACVCMYVSVTCMVYLPIPTVCYVGVRYLSIHRYHKPMETVNDNGPTHCNIDGMYVCMYASTGVHSLTMDGVPTPPNYVPHI